MNLSHNPNGALKMGDALPTCDQQTLIQRLEISRYHMIDYSSGASIGLHPGRDRAFSSGRVPEFTALKQAKLSD